VSQAGICPGKIQSAYVPTGGKDVVAGFARETTQLYAASSTAMLRERAHPLRAR